MQATSEAWFHPEPTGTAKPPARCFHCGAVVGTKAYFFGGRAPAKAGAKPDLLSDLWCLNTVRHAAYSAQLSDYKLQVDFCAVHQAAAQGLTRSAQASFCEMAVSCCA